MRRFVTRWLRLVVGASVLALSVSAVRAQQALEVEAQRKDSPTADEKPLTAEQIARQARSSLVVIGVEGREGGRQGIGTGFVISDEGLIATNLHVIGEGRPFSVELAGGQKLKVLSVHASDRFLDVAVIRVAPGEMKLSALPLGDSDTLNDGAPVVVMGNPHGLKYSVVSGVVSGTRLIDGRKMFQLAVPIEPGNSGGPVLDQFGRVHGVVTMKSVVTDNLGFAVTINQLKPLLDKPNPVPLARWLTIGRIDARRWTPLFGARWRQRGGGILASGLGDGFGGRSLCLYRSLPPQPPFEVAAYVRLNDEQGAAGLVFHADGADKHYGFYPSNGKLRFSRFEGPNVFTWRVLREESVASYRAGDWNHLKVRVEKEKLLFYVNDVLAFESQDRVFSQGQVGLAKFRQTDAEFKQFRLADRIAPSRAEPQVVADINRLIDDLPALKAVDLPHIKSLAQTADASARLLNDRANQLEQRAAELRRVANDVHVASVIGRLEKLVQTKQDFDLLTASLLLAKLDERELDVEAYVAEVDRMAEEIKQQFPAEADASTRLETLTKYLFLQHGFHGNRFDYYHRANSYLNRVVDDRTGLPITLSVLFIELGERLELRIEGVGLPGHFVVRFVPAKGEARLIDVFDSGRTMTREEAEKIIVETTQQEPDERFFQAVSSSQILARVLRNLQSAAQKSQDQESFLRYLEASVCLDPQDVQSRGLRALVCFQTGRRDKALADLDWFLQNQPQGVDLQKIQEMRDYFLQRSP